MYDQMDCPTDGQTYRRSVGLMEGRIWTDGHWIQFILLNPCTKYIEYERVAAWMKYN